MQPLVSGPPLQSFFQQNVNGPTPLPVTVKLAGLPTQTLWAGLIEQVGGAAINTLGMPAGDTCSTQLPNWFVNSAVGRVGASKENRRKFEATSVGVT
jgi:hypothetical protein